MNHKKYCALFVVLITFVFSSQALAWDATGHRLVAQIAYTQLDSGVKAKVDALSGVLSSEDVAVERFYYDATWPDVVKTKDDIKAFSAWHYKGYPFSPDGTALPAVPYENVVWAIGQAKSVLQSSKPSDAEQALAQRFLVHFVGDAHQPLHCSERVTAAHPNGDVGGNDYKIKDKNVSNLHSYWDQGVGLFRASGSQYPLTSDAVQKLADKIMAAYPAATFGSKVNDLDPEHWAKESFDIAQNFVYLTPENTTPSSAYNQIGQEYIKMRIALAGYRLAALLNQIYADTSDRVHQ